MADFPQNGDALRDEMLKTLHQLQSTSSELGKSVVALNERMNHLPCANHTAIIQDVQMGRYAERAEVETLKERVRQTYSWRQFLAQTVGTSIAVMAGIVTYLQLLN